MSGIIYDPPGGVGGAFNGGIIENALIIKQAANTPLSFASLDIRMQEGVTENAVTIKDVEDVNVVEIFPAGGIYLATNDQNNPGFYLEPFETPAEGIDIAYIGKANAVKVTRNGYLAITANTAPADAEIPTGNLALWFDKTNGAAKLMIKAKQADGTVVTGNVALT